jgi:hypothetical protein
MRRPYLIQNITRPGVVFFIKFNSPREEQKPIACPHECITSLKSSLVNEVCDRDLVGLRISNTENVHNKQVGINLRRRE